MKSSRAEIRRRVHAIPRVVFERQQLTSFAGLVIFQALFSALKLPARLRQCFTDLEAGRIFGLARVVLQLVVHVLLGFKRLRDRDYYADDPLVGRILGVTRLADVSTMTRTLAAAGERCVDRLRALVSSLVLERLAKQALTRVTVDFDGSGQSTKRHAQGVAVGYSIARGRRGYYPLFATVSQVGQFLDVLHRSGNVHDSRGAVDFMRTSIDAVKRTLPRAVVEVRTDAAFYDDAILSMLELQGVEYAVSVPFNRFPWLKRKVERRRKWIRISAEWSYFEDELGHEHWDGPRRVIFVRCRRPVRKKGPLQLDIFEPVDHSYEYKAIMTNKDASAETVLRFLNGRGVQEAIFGEAKQFAALDYIPCRRLVANKLFTLASLLAHNLAREVQMRAADTWRRWTPTRTALLDFVTLGTLRHLVLRRAGRLTAPQRKLTLTVAASGPARDEFQRLLERLQAA